MLSPPELGFLNSMVRRMVAASEEFPGFLSLTNILLRPFSVDSRETADDDTIVRLNRIITPSLPHACGDFLVFDALLAHMTLEEKTRHLATLVEMVKFLLPRHQSLSSAQSCSWCDQERACVSNFLTLYVEAVRGAEATSGELVLFVKYVMRTMPVQLDSLLPRMDPNAVYHLLTCFLNKRFHAGGIVKIDLLRYSLMRECDLFAVLIRHGFKYSFQPKFYGFCLSSLRHYDGVFSAPILSAFVESANLRMQMALEIMVCLLFERHRRNLELLCMLWNSVPYPFITLGELYHLMKNFFVRDPQFLWDVCAWYYTLFPGLPLEKQPRSLKHLARVRIRDSMVRAHSIGEKSVRRLGLPKSIQDYLWKLEAF